MGFLRFYASVIRTAVTHSVERSHTFVWIVVILAGAIPWLSHKVGVGIDLPRWFPDEWGLGGIVLTAFFASRLCFAPYWLWKNEKESRLKAEAELLRVNSLHSHIKMSISPDYAISMGQDDGAGGKLPPSRLLLVRAENVGPILLRNCQIAFGDAHGRRKLVTPPFELRPGEHRDCVVLHVHQQDNSGGPYFAAAIQCIPEGEKWTYRYHGWSWKPPPGTYQIVALSADTEASLLTVELVKEPDWHLSMPR